MPLYTFECEGSLGCGNREERYVVYDDRHSQVCDCGRDLTLLPSHPAVHVFPSGVWRDIAPNPVYVKSKSELKNLCKRHGVYAPGVLDGGDYGREI